MYKELKNCILCGGDKLTQVLDLGNQYVVDFVKHKDESLLQAPLVLMLCQDCMLVQLKHRVNPDRLYKKFWYRSGINKQMQDELLKIVQKAQQVVTVNQGDRVLDIGCNDGTLLGWYDKRVLTVGIDPAQDLVNEGVKEKRIDVGISDYFSGDVITELAHSVGLKFMRFKIITAIAMFYDLENPVQFLVDCKNCLDEEGVLIVQMNYLGAMLKDDAFDFICHEHLALYSLITLRKAVEKAGLYLQGIETTSSNGGSIRAYITHDGFDQFGKSNYADSLWMYNKSHYMTIEEMNAGYDNPLTYLQFEKRVEKKMKNLKDYIISLDNSGLPVYAYGASTRGTVLTQYLFPNDNVLKGVAERDPNKVGLKMVGTWMDILPEHDVRSKTKNMLVLPWHFEKSIVQREEPWIQEGGTLIFPLPQPHLASPIVSQDRPIAVGETL